jgi:hypothetical protein
MTGVVRCPHRATERGKQASRFVAAGSVMASELQPRLMDMAIRLLHVEFQGFGA